MLEEGQYVFAYGVFYPTSDGTRFEVKSLVFPGEKPGHYRHEEPDWWIKQVRSIADCYLRWQFGYPEKPIDFREYRTFLHLGGTKRGDYLQETDTISRLVYGFATAYLLTGEDRFLEAAEAGTQYLRDHMRFYDADEKLVYWYHGIQVNGDARAEDAHLGVRRRLRLHPGLRADLRAGRPDPDLPRHRRPEDPAATPT